MLVKVSQEQLSDLLNGVHIPYTSAYFMGLWFDRFCSEGKYTLSVKVGKNRKLLPGRIVFQHSESGGHGHPGYRVNTFVPNSRDKLDSILAMNS